MILFDIVVCLVATDREACMLGEREGKGGRRDGGRRDGWGCGIWIASVAGWRWSVSKGLCYY